MHIHIHGKTELKSAAFLIVGSYVKALLLFLTKLLFSEASHNVSVPTFTLFGTSSHHLQIVNVLCFHSL